MVGLLVRTGDTHAYPQLTTPAHGAESLGGYCGAMSLVSSFAPVAAPRRRTAMPGRPPARATQTVRLYAGRPEGLLHGAGLVVTPNLDHLRLLKTSKAFRRAYALADVVVNDSRFLDRLALSGRVLCLPGSELAPMMLDAARPGARVVVIGGDDVVRAYLAKAYPWLSVAILDPSMGYIRKRGERRALATAVLQAEPDQVFVCTGAPQSELMAAQLKRAGCEADILCCGSAFHFLSGVKRRAPMAFRTLGAECIWRFVGEAHTRRRYAADALFLISELPTFLALKITGRMALGGVGIDAG